MTNVTYARHAKLYCDWMKTHDRASIEAIAVLLEEPAQIFASKTFGANDEEDLAKWMHTMDQIGCCVMLPLPGTVVL